MPETPSFPPGSFNWTDLGTTDPDAACRFYDELLGWTTNKAPMSEDEFYNIQELGGKSVGAIYKQMDPNAPPAWLTYVCVASADESAARAKELGATILMEPFDVFEFGRQVVLADPQGAVFSLWQPKQHPGFHVYGQPGSWCWFELHTHDEAAAKAFYTSLFGWSAKETPEYTEWSLNGQPIGGMLKARGPAGSPSFWMGYIAVDDCDATVEKAKSLGGSVHVPPMDIEKVGRFSVLMDPQGAAFCVIRLTM